MTESERDCLVVKAVRRAKKLGWTLDEAAKDYQSAAIRDNRDLAASIWDYVE